MDTRLEADWRERVARVLKGASFDETLVSRSADGIEIHPLYAAATGNGACAFRQDGARPWRILQRVDHPDAAIANDLALGDLEGGVDALAIVFQGAAASDEFGLPDGSNALAVALTGVEIDLIAVTLDHAPFTERAGIAALLDLLGERRLEPETVDIGFGIDPVTAMAFAGHAPKDAMQDAAVQAADLVERGFRSPSMRADGTLHHAAGASEAEELAAALASAVACLRALEAAGLELDAARRQIAFRLSADQDMFLTIAKFRALRRLWAGIETACGLEPIAIRLEGQTSRRMLTATDTETNLLRNTLAAFSAAIGGGDAVSIRPHSSAAGLPDGFARRMARNTQAILIEECRLAVVCDPAAGSGALETLTEDLAQRAFEIFGETERAGGLAVMLERGTWQARIAVSRQRRAEAIAAGRRPILGVTRFPPAAERPASVLMPATERPAGPADFPPLVPYRDAQEHEFAGLAPQEDRP